MEEIRREYSRMPQSINNHSIRKYRLEDGRNITIDRNTSIIGEISKQVEVMVSSESWSGYSPIKVDLTGCKSWKGIVKAVANHFEEESNQKNLIEALEEFERTGETTFELNGYTYRVENLEGEQGAYSIQSIKGKEKDVIDEDLNFIEDDTYHYTEVEGDKDFALYYSLPRTTEILNDNKLKLPDGTIIETTGEDGGCKTKKYFKRDSKEVKDLNKAGVPLREHSEFANYYTVNFRYLRDKRGEQK